MSNEVSTLNANNFAAMAKAMGMAAEASSKQNTSSLARLRISHTPIMGQTEMKGKKVNVEVVPGGAYRLQIPDGPMYYATDVTIRPYMQRFMYKRFIKGVGDKPNKYVKTVMGDTLSIDLKDNEGGFNCGKPAGYIQDFQALPKQTQDLIRTIKRVRVLFGVIEMHDVVDENGESTELAPTPFIWEIDNKDAYKSFGDVFSKLAKQKRLPPMHNVTATTKEVPLPNGSSFFIPEVELNLTNTLDLGNPEQETFTDFLNWIENYNVYIINTWNEKAMAKPSDDDVSEDALNDILDIEMDEEEDAA